MLLYKDDHIKAVQSTSRIMQHWDGVLMVEYLFNLGIILIFYSCLCSVHRGSISLLPFLVAVLWSLVPTNTSHKNLMDKAQRERTT